MMTYQLKGLHVRVITVLRDSSDFPLRRGGYVQEDRKKLAVDARSRCTTGFEYETVAIVALDSDPLSKKHLECQ